MNVFLDSSGEDLCLVLFDENKNCVSFKLIKNLKEKVKNIPFLFEEMLKKNKLCLENISSFFVTTGPGNFTGSRISLLFLRTISQIKGINIFKISTLKLIEKTNKKLNNKIVIKIAKNKFIVFSIKNNVILFNKIVKNVEKYDKIDYEYLKKNFNKLAVFFKKIDNLLDTKIDYFLDPQVN